MTKRLTFTVTIVILLLAGSASTAQIRRPGGPMRIIMLVDSSSAISPMITQFRAALHGFLDQLPDHGDPEIGVVTTGGHLRVRVEPTTDRAKLHGMADGFAADGGGNVFLDTLLEADKRFFKSVPDRRPILVILTTDLVPSLGDQRIEQYNKFMNEFISKGGRAHAIVIGGVNSGYTTLISENLVKNSGGYYESVALANPIPRIMKTVAEYVAVDQ